jgi:hypothetical protein
MCLSHPCCIPYRDSHGLQKWVTVWLCSGFCGDDDIQVIVWCHQGRLIRFIDEDNVLSLLNFADMYGTELLGVAARAFILRQYALVHRRCVQRLRQVPLMDTCYLCRDMQIKATPEFEMLPASLQESVRHKAALFSIVGFTFHASLRGRAFLACALACCVRRLKYFGKKACILMDWWAARL